jgi:hypothetical protein
VIPIPRHALREGDTVWLAGQGGRLEVRTVELARVTDTTVYVAKGLAEGDRVIVSRIDAITDGMKIRVAEDA